MSDSPRENAQARKLPNRRSRCACDPCRRRKMRCDLNLPCSNCVRSKREECSYLQASSSITIGNGVRLHQRRGVASSDANTRVQASRSQTALPMTPMALEHHDQSQSATDISPRSTPTAASWYSCALGSFLVPEELDEARQPESRQTANGSQGSKNIHVSPDNLEQSLRAIPGPIRHLVVNGRFVGSSHWMQTVLLLPDIMAWFNSSSLRSPAISELLQHCNSLSDHLERQRCPRLHFDVYGQHMPNRDIADKLLRLYLDNFESLYRIIHKPTFEDAYESFWLDPTKVSTPVLLQIQLCLALGACIFDDTFSLRGSALRYISEARAWVAFTENSQPSIQKLQMLCLLQVARQSIHALQEDAAWISAGQLYRTALCAGLHVDPAFLPNISPFNSEIRRRLWATILELLLQSSLDNGNLPLLSLENCNCRAPLNLDDSRLHETDNELPVASPHDTISDTSVQIAIGLSFDIRLRIVHMSNATNVESKYEEILRVNAELTEAYRALTATLSAYGSRLTHFKWLSCETMIQPYFLALHVPYMRIAFSNPLYHFSRELCVKRALHLSHAALAPPSGQESVLAALRTAARMNPACILYTRLMTCGSGPFRSIQVQNNFIIAAELLVVTQDESSWASSVANHRPSTTTQDSQSLRSVELHALLVAAVRWAETRLVAGETNVKDYLFHVAALAHIEAVRDGQGTDNIESLKSTDALRRASTILQSMIVDEAPCMSDALVRGNIEEDYNSLWYTWLETPEDALWNLSSR